MKKIISVLFSAAMAVSLFAQTGAKPATKPAVKSVGVKPAAPILKNKMDSISYAIGVNVASFYKENGVNNLNTSLIAKGTSDVFNKKPVLFDELTANTLLNNFMNNLQLEIQSEKIKPAVTAGQAFLKANKMKAGVKTTASGLQYEILRDTVGYKPSLLDTFVCNYRGTLLNGQEFDNSYNRGQPLVWPLSNVIDGWKEGLQLMSIGSKYKFYIPYELGYGVYGNGPAIPGGSMLIFELELLDVKKPKPQ